MKNRSTFRHTLPACFGLLVVFNFVIIFLTFFFEKCNLDKKIAYVYNRKRGFGRETKASDSAFAVCILPVFI